MSVFRRMLLAPALCLVLIAMPEAAAAQAGDRTQEVVHLWYRMILELVRHTPTYTPPVASRTFGYVGVTAYEAVAAGDPQLRSLAGQLNGLEPLPQAEGDAVYDTAAVTHAALSTSVHALFANTGPTGQRAMQAMDRKLDEMVAEGISADVLTRSRALGENIAGHVLAWAQDDGGANIENMGFPQQFELTAGPGHWVPTNNIVQQQKPLLPYWGNNRPFAMPAGSTCNLPPPPDYSEERGSEFYRQALEVAETGKQLTPEQRIIARFWADDAMLSVTPPGHWVSIALQVLQQQDADAVTTVDTLARLGIGLADAFIGCWYSKFEYNLVRPITYIRKTGIDSEWEPILITPPFPEYPSGHSTQSGAAAEVLTDLFGEDFAFEDSTGVDDGYKPRRFTGFHAAAAEAGISRLYGGIHFRAAIEFGLEQGRCIAAYTNALETRN